MFLLLCAMPFRTLYPMPVFSVRWRSALHRPSQRVASVIAACCICHRSAVLFPPRSSAVSCLMGFPEATCRACLFLPVCCKARESALEQDRNRCSCGPLPQCRKTAGALTLVFFFAQSTNDGWWEGAGPILPHPVHFAPIVPSWQSGKSGGPAPGADAVLSLSEACGLPDLSQGNPRFCFNLCTLAASTM